MLGTPGLLLAQGRIVSAPDTNAQVRASGDSARYVHWVERTSVRRDHVLVHNRTDTPLTIRSIRVYDCRSIMLFTCGERAVDQVIPPESTARILEVTVPEARLSGGRSYAYTIEAGTERVVGSMARTGRVPEE